MSTEEQALSGGGRKEFVGYFPQWGIYDRKFFIRDLDRNGTAARLTILNYAFANISSNENHVHPGYKAFEATAMNRNVSHADGGIDAGDAEADWLWPFKAEQAVDGKAGQWGAQHLQGNFRELRKLREKYPQLKVLLSIGGWTYSRNFSKAAESDERRKEFVKSFIDIYLRGNLPTKIWTDTENYPKQWRNVFGGAAEASGIFDGFDIDWEWPGCDKGLPGNQWSKADKKNLPLLLKEFREQLDALDLPNKPRGGKYLLTAFLPADPGVLGDGWNVPEIMKYLDYGNLQGYDLRGGWSKYTSHQSALNAVDGDPNPDRLSVKIAVNAWLKAGAPKEKLILGIPFYGRGWQGVKSDANNGLFQEASGPVTRANGAKYEDGVNDYRDLAELIGEDGFTLHRDNDNAVAWLYSPEKKIFWTYDDATSVSLKTKYAVSTGLAGAMVYSLDGDNTGTGVLSKEIRAALDGTTPPPPPNKSCTAPAWRTEYVYAKPNRVTHKSKIWEAQYWTKGDSPDGGGAWKEITVCELPIDLRPDGARPWEIGKEYTTGTMVTHSSELFSAAWDHESSSSSEPGKDKVWQNHGSFTP